MSTRRAREVHHLPRLQIPQILEIDSVQTHDHVLANGQILEPGVDTGGAGLRGL